MVIPTVQQISSLSNLLKSVEDEDLQKIVINSFELGVEYGKEVETTKAFEAGVKFANTTNNASREISHTERLRQQRIQPRITPPEVL